MKNLLLILVLSANIIVSQETCETKEDTLEDLNSITKCTVEESSKKSKTDTRQISVKVSASKNRFLKKRKIEKKAAVASNSLDLTTSGISKTSDNSETSNSLSLNEKESIKKESYIDNIANLTNTLSAEEVKKAQRFSGVHQIPLFAACEGSKKNKALDCFNHEMIKHIQKHFRYPHDAVINKIEGDVWVRFIIDTEGNVSNIKTLGPQGGKILDGEAYRVVSKLPKFIPGVKEGEKTSVKYGFPITFSLEE